MPTVKLMISLGMVRPFALRHSNTCISRTVTATVVAAHARTAFRRQAFSSTSKPRIASHNRMAFAIQSQQPRLTRHYSEEPDHISLDDFHRKCDETLELILENFEILGEKYPAVDIELAQGVLTLDLPPNGSYVFNKQPPNKQLWWSSPLSGPKRFDLLDGKWVYLRDGSTLGDGLREETKLVTDARGLEIVEFEGIDD